MSPPTVQEVPVPTTFRLHRGGGTGGYLFQKTCAVIDSDGTDLISAFVPDFNTCIDLCSNWNYNMWATGLSQLRFSSAAFLIGSAPLQNC
jgi:hypothetical protein